jgi:branched-chain amino acid transport system substrate-binding protein
MSNAQWRMEMIMSRTSGKLLGGFGMLAVILGSSWLAAVAQEKATHRIAYIGPITGPNTSVGVGTMNSMDLAIRHANAKGDLPFKLEFISETDDSKPAAGVAAVQKICADRSVIVASAHWNSPVAMATGPYFTSCGLLNVVAGAASNAITRQGWKAVGRVNTPFRYALPALATAAYQDLGLRSIAIVHSLDDFGTDVAKEVAQEFEKLGGKIVFRDGYNVGDRDFTSLLTKVRSARPEAVVLGGLSTEAALIIRQMRQLGMKQPLLGQSGFQTVAYIDAVGEIGDGTLVIAQAPFPDDVPGGKQYIADYNAAGFRDPPDVYGVFGYVVGQTIVELMKRYGADRQAVINNFRSAKDIATIFGSQSFDDDGELQPKRVGMAVLENRTWKRLDVGEYKAKYMKQ